MSMHKLLAALALTPLALLSGSCDFIECGEGTTEMDGTCVPADLTDDPAACGQNTHFDEETMECVPDSPATECGPNTTPELGEDGVIICRGSGEQSCSDAIPCQQPDSGRMTVCGRLHDVETGEPLVTTDPETIDRCPLDGSGGGVCAIELKYYDAVAFVTDPSTSPIQTDETQTEEGGGPGDGITYIDNCGRFKASNIVPPQLGFLAIGADDHDALAADDYKTTGIAMPASSNRFVTGVNAYITRVSTDNGWTTSAGDPFNGQSFAEKGVYLPIFINPADPEPGRVSGVQVTTKGSTQPDDTYYFADPDAIISEVDETATSTGPNGAALMVNVGLSAKSGTGALPAACAWPDDQGAAVEAVVFVQERHAEDANDENMECMEPSP